MTYAQGLSIALNSGVVGANIALACKGGDYTHWHWIVAVVWTCISVGLIILYGRS